MHLRIGTRGSPLALAQVDIFIKHLSKVYEFTHEIIIIKTTGDKILDKPLYDIGGKALFIKELETALIDGVVDVAIHSLKDVPGETSSRVSDSDRRDLVSLEETKNVIARRTKSDVAISGVYTSKPPEITTLTSFARDDVVLKLGCYLPREYPLDCLVSYKAKSIQELPKNAKVGSSSPRRAVFLKKQRPDLEIFPLRGNVNSRLKKLADGEYDAIILAEAGLRRLRLYNEDYCHVIQPEEMIPAVGQGIITAQYASSNHKIKEILKLVDDPDTRKFVDIERDFLSELNANCRTPVAGFVLGNRAMFMLADDDMSNVKILEKSFDSVCELDGREIAMEIAIRHCERNEV